MDLEDGIGDAARRRRAYGRGLPPAQDGRDAQRRAEADARLASAPLGEADVAQPGVDELVDAEVEQRQPGPEQCYADAGRSPPPPPPATNRVVGEPLAQHVPPVPEARRR